jgi:phage terminase small subunit
MGRLSNRRHELYCIELASGAPMVTAFLRAGYKDSPSAKFNASRLKNMPRVRARINELIDEFKERSFVELSWIQAELVAIVEGRADSSTTEEEGKVVRKRDRLAALAQLTRTLIGMKVEVKHELADSLAAAIAGMSASDQHILSEALFASAETAEPGETVETSPAPRPAPPPKPAPEPAPPPAAEPPRSGRLRFLQLARMRAAGPCAVQAEFDLLSAHRQRALVRFCSPSLHDETDRSTSPASPPEIADALRRFSPSEVAELLNSMTEKSDTF